MGILNDELIDAKANLCWNHQQEQLKGDVEIDCICKQLADMIYLTRQEIAKEIEASGHIMNCYALLSETPSNCNCGLDRHIAIARGNK